MHWTRRLLGTAFLLALCLLTGPMGDRAAVAAEIQGGKTVGEVYGDLAAGPLRLAQLKDLPPDILLQGEGLEITARDLESELQKATPEMREQLKKNGFFLLEQIAIPKLLVKEARLTLRVDKADLSPQEEIDLVQRFLQSLTQMVAVTDEETKAFYEKNKDLFGGEPFAKVESSLKAYLLQEKQQQALSEHFRSLGQRMSITVNAEWTQKQYALSRDNPVDNARSSEIPTLVDFGATGCRPCDMMTPILESLKNKYSGKLNVLFVHVGKEKILAARFGIQTIPVQVFFDRSGKEIFRHTGFFAQAEIEKKLTEMGLD
jgi:thiol-disulfide isomerase/thioredoxin